MVKSSSPSRAPLHNSSDFVDINTVPSWSRLKQLNNHNNHNNHNNPSCPSGLEQLLEQLLVQTVLGYQSVMEAFGRISSSTCPSSRYSHLEFWTLAFALISFSSSVFGCCLWSTSYFRDACFAWFNSGYMFYGRLLANFTYFLRAVNSDPWRSLSIPQNGEVCAVDASSCSVSSRGSHFESGHYLYEFSMVAVLVF